MLESNKSWQYQNIQELRAVLGVRFGGVLKHVKLDGQEGNVLFNDALNTLYLRLYGVRHMVKDPSVSERGNPLPPHALLFPISSKGSFICTIPDKIAHTTAFCTRVVEHWLERRLYGVRHMVKDHSDSERGNPLRHICSIPHTMAFVTYVVKHRLEREIAQSIHPSHHQGTLLPRRCISLRTACMTSLPAGTDHRTPAPPGCGSHIHLERDVAQR